MTSYLPILRSRAAELRGLKEMSEQSRAALLPVIELTRSRRTTKNPGGDVVRSVEAVLEILKNQPFIADLTSLESLQNSEFDRLLDDAQGFDFWTSFALDTLPAHCIPTVHLLEPFELASFQAQANKLKRRFTRLAIRVPTNYVNFADLIAALRITFDSPEEVVIILDASFVTTRTVEGAIARMSEMLAALASFAFYRKAVASSSFPNSVVAAGGRDNQGSFPLSEVALWLALSQRFADVDYADYAGIHPMDFTGTVTNWVPRVDVMLQDSFFYHRYRRSDGGYVRAASEALRDPRYVPLSCWAHDNIVAAADGSPAGRSPSFWIANRVNFHLNRQIVRVG